MTETTEENIKPRAGALGSTIEENMLPKIKSKLKKQADLITKLEAQFSSLTKERDELADRVKNLKETAAVAVKDNRSLRSQLSNRDKEIEELKQNIRNFINEGEGFCPDCLDRALKDPEVDNDILRAQKSALQIHRNIKKRQDKKIESYENFKDSVLRSIKDCREVEPSLADCFENTCGIHVLLASLNKEGEGK